MADDGTTSLVTTRLASNQQGNPEWQPADDITLWETAMLIEKGRIQVNTDCQSFLELALDAYDMQVRPITP